MFHVIFILIALSSIILSDNHVNTMVNTTNCPVFKPAPLDFDIEEVSLIENFQTRLFDKYFKKISNFSELDDEQLVHYSLLFDCTTTILRTVLEDEVRIHRSRPHQTEHDLCVK